MDGPEVLAPLFFFTFLTLVIVLPIFWRHRQYALQLEVIAKALEKGIDPERIQLKPPTPDQVGDPNGNWKAGLILVSFGLFMLLCFVLPMYNAGEFSSADAEEYIPMFAAPGIFIIPGAMLMFIHYSIVGKVIKRGEQRRFDEANKAGELSL